MADERSPDRIAASSRRPIYVERINAVVDYIEQHIAEELTVDRLAAVAHFSPFHFHRVFGVLVGETVAQFVSRVRIERAAWLLVQRPYSTVTEVGAACGYPNPSSFARSFKETFGVTASEWRDGGYLEHRPADGQSIRDVIGNIGAVDEVYGITETSLDPMTGRASWRIRCGSLGMASVRVANLAEIEVAYVRYTGRYQGMGEVFADLFNRLTTWAEPRGFLTSDAWLLAVYHDNPSITETDRLRVSACISVPDDVAADGDIGRMRLDGGACALGRFELGEQDYPEAWYSLAGGWLPDSGYEPDDRLPFERFFIGSAAASPSKEIVEIGIPVRPLRRY